MLYDKRIQTMVLIVSDFSKILFKNGFVEEYRKQALKYNVYCYENVT